MVADNNIRPFVRTYDGVQLRLRLEDWPTDVPLPPDTAIVGIGEDHQELVPPYRRFVLKPDETIEVFGGWFRTPRPFEETVNWYKTELVKCGWAQEKETRFDPKQGVELIYCHPETTARLRLSLKWWEALNDTTTIIERVLKHPYTPPAEEAAAAEAAPVPAEADANP